MEKWSLTALADGLLSHAVSASTRRSGCTVHGGLRHQLRQTMIASVAGADAGQLRSSGRGDRASAPRPVRIAAGDDTTDGSAGQLLIVPAAGHTVQALDDTVVLLTVVERAAPRAPEPGS
jgi:hypothetical protein